MARAQLAPRARHELLEATRWIGKDSPGAARRLQHAVIDAAERLGANPFMGTRRLELASERYRFLVLTGYPYILVFDCERRPPIIARIVHGARDLPEVLRDL